MSPQEALSHAPVLTEEVIEHLAVQPGGRYVDCTTGAGGHARAILEAASPGGLLLALDADARALAVARDNLSRFGDSVMLVEANFRELALVCLRHSFVPVHGILFDLGLSSLQLADAERGFSFQAEAPLDMRFSAAQQLTAGDIVNHYGERELADLIWRFGEEPASRRIARAIVRSRPISTTTDLASLVARAVRGPRARIHPATRTFQALRIAVNDELAALESALEQARDVLGPGGRLVVISFHSLEDRIVKQFFRRESRDCICPPEYPACSCGHRATLRVVTRRSVTPRPAEVAANPRSRSARLRAAEKLAPPADRREEA
ncbi:MAG: 16S rRNA (cytosine(1402)-N(4))-methyltransferase RsmH [Dehalococcoidia bacterium]|nr:16S rRNA (cytosine(1402)-N(4))-methyltransferase RsmH [Dehalococcoidia bacterium]